MRETLRSMLWDPASDQLERLVEREWLVTNGLGGYSSGTVAGVVTRRYHGLLVAAMNAPLGRMMMLNHLSEQVRLEDGTTVRLSGEEQVPHHRINAANHLREFRLESGLPVWRFEVGNYTIEKLIFMPREHNTVHVTYRLLEGEGTLRLKLLPAVHFRPHDAPVNAALTTNVTLKSTDDQLELSAGSNLPTLRLTTYGLRTAFTIERRRFPEVLYRIEQSRGYEAVGDLWSPGYFRFDLCRAHEATLVASTEPWEQVLAMTGDDALAAEKIRRCRLLAAAPPAAQSGVAGELVLAADEFVIKPVSRAEDSEYVRATGDEPRTVIAGYHWFTDWGRDTMISLEGLTLSTGRAAEAGYILRTFAHYVRDGLIPNHFPEGEEQGLYHTADATLWFFHAVDRYLSVTEDRGTLESLLPTFQDIIDRHIQGTRFHIGMDPADGLLRQGEPGYQLTWMDAKMGDWVVTPRRGKAVEINALWYNAVRLLAYWLEEMNGFAAAQKYTELAERIERSFNERFWLESAGYLYDLVDGEHGDDPACRPNQLMAISLPHPVLREQYWQPVVEVVRERLLTPVGLRSLAPEDPNYKPTYHGDLRSRDAAYHQGTVWAWLIGPFIDAWLRVFPDDLETARGFLAGLADHLGEACLGTVSEVFDAEPPFTPRGCCAQAWSVAEMLRSWIRTEAETTS